MKDEDIECFEEVIEKEDDQPSSNEQKASAMNTKKRQTKRRTFEPLQLPNINQYPNDLSLHQEAVRVFQNNAKSRHHSDETRNQNEVVLEVRNLHWKYHHVPTPGPARQVSNDLEDHESQPMQSKRPDRDSIFHIQVPPGVVPDKH